MNKFIPHIKQIFRAIVILIVILLIFVMIDDYRNTLHGYLRDKNTLEATTNRTTCYIEVSKLKYSKIIPPDEFESLNHDCWAITESIK
jgi:hypothetical protein